MLLSQSAEDQNHAARHIETKSFNGKAPARSIYARLISERILGVRHDFNEVQASSRTSSELVAGSRLSSSLFESKEEPTMNMTPISSFKATPDWHSPGVERLHLPFVDMLLLQQPGLLNDLSLLNEVGWTSLLLTGDRFLVRQKPVGMWVMPLGSPQGGR